MPITDAELDLMETHLTDAWLPSVWKGDLRRLAAEVKRMRRLCADALLEIQFPAGASVEKTDLMRNLRETTRE